MQRRVEETDRHGAAVHRREDAREVLALKRKQVRQSGFALGGGARHDHAPHGADALSRPEEHVLRAHEPDALGAVLARHRGVLGGVRVRQHLQAPLRVHPGHERPEVAGDGGGRELGGAANHLAGGAVEGHPVPLVQLDAAERQPTVLLVHHQLRAPGDARLAPAARHHSRVRGHAAARRQDALGGVHAADVLGRSLHAHQHALLALRLELLGGGGVEDHLAHRRARRGGQADTDDVRGVRRLVPELRVQKLVDVRVLDHPDGGARVDQPLAHEVDGDLHRAGAGAFPRARLEHVQLALLHGELDVLHVLVVLLQQLRVAHQVFVRLRQRLAHARDVLRGADARHDVLALRVHQVLAVQRVLARARVARETDARAGRFAHVPENHGLNVHRGAFQADDAVDGHVLLRAVAVPAVKHRVRRQSHLLRRFLRETHAGVVVHGLVPLHELAQIFLAELVVGRHAHLAFQRVDLLLEQAVVDAHHHVAVHVQEPAVRVEGELLAGFAREALHHLVV